MEEYVDKKLLKRAALDSVLLLIIVLMTSFLLPVYLANSQKDNEIEFGKQPNHLLEQSDSNDNIDQGIQIDVQEIAGEISFDDIKEGDRYLTIRKPEGSEISLEIEDLYLSKSIRLIFSNLKKSDITSEWIGRVNQGEVYYGDPQIGSDGDINLDVANIKTYSQNDDVVKFIYIIWDYDTEKQSYSAEITITLDHIYDLRIEESEQSYYIYLRRPHEVYDKVLVIDAGHGGKDVGAIAADGLLYEKQINLQVLLELRKLLEKDHIKVYYTRTDDQQVYLRPRVELANDVEADFFISIHSNASVIQEANGIDIYYYEGYHQGVCTKELAILMLDELVKVMPLRNRGITERKGDEIFILEHASVPALIIEMGYITNYDDMSYLNDNQNQKNIAQGIYSGISMAYERYYGKEMK